MELKLNDYIPQDIIKNKNIIKVLDGIAGSAKSSMVHKEFSEHGYQRFTSTVKLMKDAVARFNCPCNTIAGGLFTTEKGKFFVGERTVESDTVVIDEILQTNKRVLEWINNNVGNYNIIICTDSRQMLPPEIGNEFIRSFKDFCKQDNVCYINLTKTYRARNSQTEELFNLLYEYVENDERNMFNYLKEEFKTIEYKDMPFNINSVYLTHTNDIEEFLYRDKDIIHNTNLEFIAKGCIAKRDNVNYENYPILCQNQATKRKITNYLQASNIGTVTRYQGSEVKDKQKCYFLIEENSRVCNREFYTALTRCWNKDSFIIVICKNVKDEKLTTFRGKPIKKPGFIHVKKEELPQNAINEKEQTVTKEVFKEIYEAHTSDLYHYSTDTIYIDGLPYTKEMPKTEYKQTKYSALGLLKKEPDFDYSFMERVYKILDEKGIDYIKTPHFCGDLHDKTEFNRQFDLFSAYPHIVKYEYLPIDGNIYYEELPDKMGFYFYEGPWFEKCIISSALYKTLKKFLPEDSYKMTFLFSTDVKRGSKMGDTLVEACKKSVEEKAETKQVHWGYFEKQYLQKYDDCYVRNEYFNHQLLMISILSSLYSLILTIAIYLNGIDLGRICVDAVYYNEEDGKTESLIKALKGISERYEYRILDDEDNVVYKTYETLKTKAQIKRERNKEFMRKKRAEQKKNN